MKEARVRLIVYGKATVCAAVALLPLPVADLAVIAPLQIGMVAAIGWLHGVQVTWERTIELLTTLGAGFAFREGARQLIKLLPGAGSVISATIAFAGTVGLGEAANMWFKARGSVDQEEVRQAYQKAAAQAKEEYPIFREAVGTAGDVLQNLEAAREAGAITEDEYRQRLVELDA